MIKIRERASLLCLWAIKNYILQQLSTRSRDWFAPCPNQFCKMPRHSKVTSPSATSRSDEEWWTVFFGYWEKCRPLSYQNSIQRRRQDVHVKQVHFRIARSKDCRRETASTQQLEYLAFVEEYVTWTDDNWFKVHFSDWANLIWLVGSYGYQYVRRRTEETSLKVCQEVC